MEYVAAGDVAAEGVHMLSTGGMLGYAEAAERESGPAGGRTAERRREAVVATEVGMLYPLQMAAPDVEFIPANAEASCKYMKMITLPKLRDSLREGKYEVRVPEDTAARARIPIDRMVAIG
jgi:quinolinate synthase